MDGFKERLKSSLRLRLAWWLSAAIVATALAAGALSFAAAFNEANELQDDILRQVAGLVGPDHERSAPVDVEADASSHLIVRSLNPAGREAAPAFPATLKDGVQTVRVADASYRVLVTTRPDGQRWAVAQDTDVRDEVARDSALRTVLPLLVLMPVLVWVVVDLIGKMLRPITDLSNDIDRRSEGELHALDAQRLPSEIRPFVTAINRLLGRVDQAMAAQRRFVADAAHELRSPLTALSLQAERLDGAEMSADVRKRVSALRQGIARGRRLLDQLLDLARTQADARPRGSVVSVRAVFRRVLEDLLLQAEAKAIDIGIEDGAEVRVTADEQDLLIVVRNLVDNAIRYTPAGGRIDLLATKTSGHVLLAVEDSGPGISAAERARVLDPFYRVGGSDQAGSGLGLSIVKAVVDRLGGRIELHSSSRFDSGLRVSVELPAHGEEASPDFDLQPR
jgi:two-component system OmpR family sensor kinase